MIFGMTGQSRRSWREDREGTTAIEFSMLAVPFVFFVIGIIELAMLFAAQAIFKDSIFSAARIIRTGELQLTAGDDPASVFREALCEQEMVIIDCNDVEFTVKTLATFTDPGDSPEMDETGHMEREDADGDGEDDPLPFDAGGISDVVRIDATYLYPMLTLGIGGRFFSNYDGMYRLLRTTVVLQTEPYGIEDDE